MKKLLITTASLALMVVSAYSQGAVNFANVIISGTARPVDAPVYDERGSAGGTAARLTGTGFQAVLFARPTGSGAFAQVGAAQPFLAAATFEGYWVPGSRTIPGVPAGSQADLQARAYRVNDQGSIANTWDAAVARGRGLGESRPITITLTGAPAPPALMVGLQSFQLVPEPSTIALGILGGLGTLFLVRRRKN